MQNHLVKYLTISYLAASLLVINSCQPGDKAPNTTPTASSTPAASPSASSTPATSPSASSTPATSPSASSTPATSPSASSTPTASPSASSTPTASPSASSTPTPGSTATPVPRIVFQNSRSFIYILDATGLNLTQLTGIDKNTQDDTPNLSPDGKQIAFTSFRDGDSEIYLMSNFGSAIIQLTNNTSSDFNPAWSPDGKYIAFASNRDATQAKRIYVMKADGTDVRKVSNTDTLSGFDSHTHPTWSPDGKRIAFQADKGDSFTMTTEIYAVNEDGTNQKSITNSPPSSYRYPNWAPGNKIVFDWKSEIYVLDPNTATPPAQITINTSEDAHPAWSPDGKKIVFISNRENTGLQLYTMNADGSEQQRITNLKGDNLFPHWH